MSQTQRVLVAALCLTPPLLYVAWTQGLEDPRVEVTVDEVVLPDEAAITKRIVERALTSVRHEATADRLTKRDAHAEPHGCVTARVKVRDDLEEGLQQGVFAEPGRTYDAWVRFSNGTARDDTQADARGMAIKLMGVAGQKLLPDEAEEQTQDFLMINYPSFFAKDVGEYEEFFIAQARAGELPLDALLRAPRQFFAQIDYFVGWNPLRWRLRELKKALDATTQKVGTPLGATYFSMLPFKLGPYNVKYLATPCASSRHLAVEMPEAPGPHYLREALVAGLETTKHALWEENEPPAACFELRVQRQDPTKNMPVEDATIEWRERDAKFESVATIEIPFQVFNTDEQNRFCENLSFTPWHALAAHRPIGSLNRSRRAAYAAVSSERHKANSTPRHEPRGFCLRLDGQACESALAEASPKTGGEP